MHSGLMKYMVLGPGLRMSGPCVILLTLILLPLAYSDFVTLYVHREEPKIINENGPCSTVIEVDRDLAIADVLDLVSKRLDAPIALLVEEGGVRLPLSNVSIVADGTAWHALEAAHVENKTRCELAPLTVSSTCMAWHHSTASPSTSSPRAFLAATCFYSC